MKVKVKVPATSANLGPGFDVLGLAVNLFNEFHIEEDNNFSIDIKGYNGITKNKDNLFYESFSYIFKKEKKRIPCVKITMNLNIPQGKGFGSSATAVIGGIVAANVWLGHPYTKDELLPIAVDLERGKHPDNVTPALFGGMTVVSSSHKGTIYLKLPFPKCLKAIYFVPDFIMDTVTTRKLMPKVYKKEDLVFSTGNVALMLAAFQMGKFHLLKKAMEDKVHQPTRAKVFPQMERIIKSAIVAGAYGAALSGGGSSIVAFCDKKYENISKKMMDTALKNGVKGETLVLDINHTGSDAKIIEL